MVQAVPGCVDADQDSTPYLDRLVCECSQRFGERDELQKLRALLEQGQIEAAVTAARAACPELLEDGRLVFMLHRQQFVELAQQGDNSRALECARQRLAPLALDAYPEAYSEFKRALLLLIYDTDARKSQQGSSAQAGPSASQGRGGVRASDAEAAVLNSKVQALADALLLPGRDAAPLEKEGGLGPASYPEADVQALVQGAGSTRREALGALQRHDKQAWPAFKSELARLRINRPLLRELMAEYLEAAGLEAGPTRAALPGGSQAAAPSMPSPAASVPGLPSSPRGQDCRLQPGSPCEGGWRSGSGSQGSERGERGSQASPGSSEHGTSRSASQSPPSKVQRRTGSRNPLHRGLSRASSGACHSAEASQEGGRDLDSAAPAASTMTAVPRHITIDPGHQGSAATPPSSTLVPPPLSISQLPALALQGGARALLQAVEALDPGLLPSQPDLHFRLVQARMAELLAAGQCGAAVLMAREQLAPLAEREPSLQGPLKAAMGSLVLLPPLEPGCPGPALPPLQPLVRACCSALRASLGVGPPRLVRLLQVLLQVHAGWLAAEAYQDPFQDVLHITSLRQHLLTPAQRAMHGQVRRTSRGRGQGQEGSGGQAAGGRTDRIASLVALGMTGLEEAMYADQVDSGEEEWGGEGEGEGGRGQPVLGAVQGPGEGPAATMQASESMGALLSLFEQQQVDMARVMRELVARQQRMHQSTDSSRAQRSRDVPAPIARPQSAAGSARLPTLRRPPLDEAAVLNVIAILEIPRSQAIELLREHQGDVEAAITTYLQMSASGTTEAMATILKIEEKIEGREAKIEGLEKKLERLEQSYPANERPAGLAVELEQYRKYMNTLQEELVELRKEKNILLGRAAVAQSQAATAGLVEAVQDMAATLKAYTAPTLKRPKLPSALSNISQTAWDYVQQDFELQMVGLQPNDLPDVKPAPDVPAYQWQDCREDDQKDAYMLYIRGIIPLDERTEWIQGDKHRTLLNANQVHKWPVGEAELYHLSGTTDAAAVLTAYMSMGLPWEGIRLTIVVKKQIVDKWHFEAAAQLICANITSSKFKPLAILTDLVDEWHLKYMSGHKLCAGRFPSRAAAVACIRDGLQKVSRLLA
ncbi:hypothetical protein QJQ45_020661 [Haematococcus lacustris]|nr:hypothetical protein QJQ45_020661 [Haematococcus lacustris]